MSGADWVDHLHEYDRNGASRQLYWPHSDAAGGQYEIGRQRDQFGRILRNEAVFTARPARLDPQIVALGPTQLLQGMCEGGAPQPGLRVVFRKNIQRADQPFAVRLLSTRR